MGLNKDKNGACIKIYAPDAGALAEIVAYAEKQGYRNLGLPINRPCIKLYCSDMGTLQQLADYATAKKYRFATAKLKKAKPHGFAHEYVWQVKGLSSAFWDFFKYYTNNEAERLAKAADLARREAELRAERDRLPGVASLLSSSLNKNKPAEGGGVG